MRWRALETYFAHSDPLVRTANLVALVVVGNQPFYPLYVYFSVSPVIWPTALTFLSTPLFLAVPAISRLSGRGGRATLVLAGLANTALTVVAFGSLSGVALFLGPCVVLAGMLFGQAEKRATYGLIGAAGLVALLARFGPATGLHAYTAEEYERFSTLNGLSVLSLLAFLAFLLPGLVRPSAQTPAQR